MQHSFKSFIQAIQTAVVESSEAINKRNEKVIQDYFTIETEDVMLENGSYNKDLLEEISKLKLNSIFKDYSLRNLVFGLIKDEWASFSSKSFGNNTSNDDSVVYGNAIINDDDQLICRLIQFLTLYGESIKTMLSEKIETDKQELVNTEKEIEILEIDLKTLESLDENKKVSTLEPFKIAIEKAKTNLEEKQSVIISIENNLDLGNQWLNKVNSWITEKNDFEDVIIKTEIKQLNEFVGDLKGIKNFPNYATKLLSIIKGFEKDLNNQKKSVLEAEKIVTIAEEDYAKKSVNITTSEDLTNKIKEIDTAKSELINKTHQKEQLVIGENSLTEAVAVIKKSISIYKEKKHIINDNSLDDNTVLDIITSIKRYKYKEIESFIPKTVRLNYPATFDYATPDNDKDFKVVSTPIEVPLLTLVPISSCNIEKAVLKANFKFNMDDDDVKIDFTNDKFVDKETSSNFGSLEIVLSPTQTPEGLKALIESYENFLKRQIV